MSDFDTRPGDEIEPEGEGTPDMFVGPDVPEEDVTVDDIHEQVGDRPSPRRRRSP